MDEHTITTFAKMARGEKQGDYNQQLLTEIFIEIHQIRKDQQEIIDLLKEQKERK